MVLDLSTTTLVLSSGCIVYGMRASSRIHFRPKHFNIPNVYIVRVCLRYIVLYLKVVWFLLLFLSLPKGFSPFITDRNIFIFFIAFSFRYFTNKDIDIKWHNFFELDEFLSRKLVYLLWIFIGKFSAEACLFCVNISEWKEEKKRKKYIQQMDISIWYNVNSRRKNNVHIKRYMKEKIVEIQTQIPNSDWNIGSLRKLSALLAFLLRNCVCRPFIWIFRIWVAFDVENEPKICTKRNRTNRK